MPAGGVLKSGLLVYHYRVKVVVLLVVVRLQSPSRSPTAHAVTVSGRPQCLSWFDSIHLLFVVTGVCFSVVRSLGFGSTDLGGLQSRKSINQKQCVCSLGLLPKAIPPLLSCLSAGSRSWDEAGAEAPKATSSATLQIIILTGFFTAPRQAAVLDFFTVPCEAGVPDSLPGRSRCPAVAFSFSLSKMCCSGNLPLPEKTDPA